VQNNSLRYDKTKSKFRTFKNFQKLIKGILNHFPDRKPFSFFLHFTENLKFQLILRLGQRLKIRLRFEFTSLDKNSSLFPKFVNIPNRVK